jgi:Cd2+/Zn2+-exporting ATPase
MIPIRPSSRVVASFGQGLMLAVSVFVLLGLVTACNDHKTPPDNHRSSMKTVVIPVEGMSCMACAARVKKTLGSIAGVGDVHVSLAERNARVRFDPSRLAPDRLVAAISGLGYHAGPPREVP